MSRYIDGLSLATGFEIASDIPASALRELPRPTAVSATLWAQRDEVELAIWETEEDVADAKSDYSARLRAAGYVESPSNHFQSATNWAIVAFQTFEDRTRIEVIYGIGTVPQ